MSHKPLTQSYKIGLNIAKLFEKFPWTPVCSMEGNDHMYGSDLIQLIDGVSSNIQLELRRVQYILEIVTRLVST